MVGMRKAALASFSTLLLLCSILMLISTSATAEIWNLVEMEAPSEVEVPVGPRDNNIVHVDANVSFPINGTGNEYIRFSANCSLGETTIEPWQWIINLSGNRTQEVDIIIEMPFGTSSYERPVVDIYASPELYPDEEPKNIHSMNVTILPYYRITVVSDRSLREVSSGESTTFDLEVHNTGNRHDNYTFSIANTDELEEDGITVELTDTIALQEGEEREIKVRVHTTRDTAVRPHTIWIQTESLGSEGLIRYDYPLLLDVRIDTFQFVILPSAIVIVVIAILIGLYFLKKKR